MSFIRLTVQRKVFLSILALTAVTVAIIFASTQWNLAQGFGRHAAEMELQRLDGLVSRLATGYRREGNWKFVMDDARLWRHLLRESLRPEHDDHPDRPMGPPPHERPPPSPDGRFRGPPPGDRFHERPPPPPDGHFHEHPPPPPDDYFREPPPPPPAMGDYSLKGRLRLVDAQGGRVVGTEVGNRSAVERPVVVDGKTVGRLLLDVPQIPVGAQAMAFLVSQIRALWLASAVALLLACVAAWLLARHFLGPIRQLTLGARQIAGGQYAVRIPVQRGDELGDLAVDFNAMAEVLARTEESRQQWISDTSHELRTPLAVLRAEIEALQDGVRAPGEASYARLHKQIMQLGKLVDDLRYTLAHTPEGIALDRHPVAPLAILRETVEQFRPRFVAARLALDTAALPANSPELWGDADRLRQVFANLLENTLRYTSGNGRLQITADAEGDQLWIQFDDTAPAPPAEALPRIFDRFYRAEPSRSRTYGGSGLGLAICKSLVEAHGGKIGATLSQLGGLSIRLSLPLEN
ncbi:MAG: ATP-binding protein [Sulfuricellaceae bacterium]